MEKGVKMENINLATVSPLVLAYLGDTVYESRIREYLINKNVNKKVNDLHKTAIKYVKAKAQANVIITIEDSLTEEEHRIYKKGRNQKSHTTPKNADIIDYKNATGFEALIGYLHMKKDYDRVEEIIKRAIEITEERM